MRNVIQSEAFTTQMEKTDIMKPTITSYEQLKIIAYQTRYEYTGNNCLLFHNKCSIAFSFFIIKLLLLYGLRSSRIMCRSETIRF